MEYEVENHDPIRLEEANKQEQTDDRVERERRVEKPKRKKTANDGGK